MTQRDKKIGNPENAANENKSRLALEVMNLTETECAEVLEYINYLKTL